MKSKFIFLQLNAQFDMPKCKFIIKNSRLVVFSLTFVPDKKIIFAYNFVAPLKSNGSIATGWQFSILKGSSFLKIGVILASFKESGNIPASRNSIMQLVNTEMLNPPSLVYDRRMLEEPLVHICRLVHVCSNWRTLHKYLHQRGKFLT